jgi:hypothetical protein
MTAFQWVGFALLAALAIGLTVWYWRARLMAEDLTPKNVPDADRRPEWSSDDVVQSLRALRDEVDRAAQRAANWYWVKKKTKSVFSQIIRGSSLALTALAGLVPVGVPILRAALKDTWLAGSFTRSVAIALGDRMAPTLLVGTAAALLGLDKAFGFSTGWVRYVLAATEIARRQAEFHMDWLALYATACSASTGSPAAHGPTDEQIAGLIKRAKDFRMAVEMIVVDETKDWATEFQNNMAQLERDIKSELEKLQAKVDEQQKAGDAASQTGSIEATIANGDKTGGFTVTLEGDDGVVVQGEQVAASSLWKRASVKPGQYTLTVVAETAASPPVSLDPQSATFTVTGGGTARPSITLPT